MHSLENNIENITSPEKEPAPLATVFIVRHGDTEYKEELVNPEIKNDLTDIGESQIQELGGKINAKIKAGETVYIMSSPRTRASNTARILGEAIKQSGRDVIELKGGKTSLRNFKLLDSKEMDIYEKKNNKEEYLADMERIFERLEQERDYYFKYRAGKVKQSHTQPLEEYKKKIGTFLRRIVEIARKRGRDNEKLILTTHGEWLDSVLELYMSHKIEKLEDSAGKGELIKLEILPNKLKFYFRGQEVLIDA
ncbi:MAG: phosphoglycerate mutase family protein [bacterium]|nr:phosphoglycerate mutase family protein [bacterium]